MDDPFHPGDASRRHEDPLESPPEGLHGSPEGDPPPRSPPSTPESSPEDHRWNGAPVTPTPGRDVDPNGSKASIETATPQSLDPAFVTVERIGNWVFTLIVALGSIVFVTLSFILGWFEPEFRIWLVPMGVGAVAFFAVLAEWHPRRVYRWTRYVVDDQFLEISRGRLLRRVITVPRSRVQHTDVVDGPLLRRFGLANLNIYTAGTQHAMVQLRGLSRADANRIRDGLIGRA